MVPLVIDCDAGLDDAWGLLLALEGKPNVDLLGVTCVHGNTTVDNVCSNVQRLLATAQRTDIPVFRGSVNPIVTCDPYERPLDFLHFHGLNGFGDVELPKVQDAREVRTENAIVALNRMALENKDELTVACFGPLTNIALVIRTFPEFVDNIKELFIMGGNHKGSGNTTMCAEFNFFRDPEAAHIVLSSACGKITILPWETCLNTHVPYAWREALVKDGGKVMSLMDQAEAPILERGRSLGLEYWINCDQLLASIVIDQEIIKQRMECYATVELGGHHTRGQMVVDHLRERKPNVSIITEVDVEKHKQRLLALKKLT
ncbi:hypothetical protein AAG570_001931 [Ranatra chinensis]|uniref:Inosine/uridine-preferring nucleoside hydrolase domain-containing protein n=1 Tax=Ranatra chinensis TaxID=642074 RepID=A0ABD0YA67_9HEMI